MPLCVFRVPIFPPSEGVQKRPETSHLRKVGEGAGGPEMPYSRSGAVSAFSHLRKVCRKRLETSHLRKVGEGAGGPEMPYSRSGAVSAFSHLRKVCRNGPKRPTFGRWERALEDRKCPTAVLERFPHFPTFGRCAENGRKCLTFGRWAERDRKHPAFGRWTTCNDI